MTALRFGLGSPVFPVEETQRAARCADEAGFDGLWIPECLVRVGDRGQAREPLAGGVVLDGTYLITPAGHERLDQTAIF
jgi:alkanesulfonate monooxygenase SsuD/methylene tetrahydromethanopterin reductase-like flavin-dependent oxidoreductase (luciferase family)